MPDPGQTAVLSPRNISFFAAKYWTNDREREIAIAIALAESGGNTYAHNVIPPDDSYGLWQINMRGDMGAQRRQKYGLKSNDDLYMPDTNARVAYGIFADAGHSFTPWTTWKTGKIMSYMSEAADAAQNPDDVVPLLRQGAAVNPLDTIISGVIDAIVKVMSPFLLRTAGFFGGILLIFVAIRLYVKGGFK